MICRSSAIKNLTKSILYSLSQKKTTQQYRKSIEQLKKQHEQRQPKPNIDQLLKPARQFLQRQQKAHDQIASQPIIQQKREKSQHLFKSKNKKRDDNQRKNRQNQNPQQSTNNQTKQQNPNINRDWLQFNSQENSIQLTALLKQALTNFSKKNYQNFKETFNKIKTKFSSEGIEYLLLSLFKQHDFANVYSTLLKEADIDVKKLNSKNISTILIYLAKQQEFTRLSDLFNQLQESKILLDVNRYDEFLDILFFKELSQQDRKYQFGENSVKISENNKLLLDKLNIVNKYFKILEFNNKKKKSLKRPGALPLWFDWLSKTIQKHQFAKNQFKQLLTSVLTTNQYVLPEWYYETKEFSSLLKQFYFGSQQGLDVIFEIFEKNSRLIKFSSFYKNFIDQLMNYQIENETPAFEVTEHIVQTYKKAFETKNKYLAILCTVIAADARYIDLTEHYFRFYMQGFPNQTLNSQDNRFGEQSILNNYKKGHSTEKNEKMLTKLERGGSNLFTRLKSFIKLGDNKNAWKLFEEQVYKKVAIERQKKNIEFVLRNRLDERHVNYISIKQIKEFIDNLNDQYLWTLHKNSQDLSLMLKKYLPEDKFSFWEETEKKNRYNNVAKMIHQGSINRLKQPKSDIESDGFSLDQYIANEYPQLKDLQTSKYESQKQMLKYTFRIQSLLALQKIQIDKQLLQKLKQYSQQLNQQNQQILEDFGIKDFNIKQYGWQPFTQRFQRMKLFKYTARDQYLDFSRYSNYLERMKSINNKLTIQQIMIKLPHMFVQAQQLVKLKQQPLIEKLLLWGVYTNQPMAIYLGQKLAMQTGQIIPHDLALKVSKMLSHKRALSEQFINECKQCLKIVGKIDRQFIYSFDKDYEHILVRKNFHRFVNNYYSNIKEQNDLTDLISYNPRQLFHKDTKFYIESIQNRTQNLII